MKTKRKIKTRDLRETNAAVSCSTAVSRKFVHPAKILVAVDFSNESKKAVKYAVALARRFGSSIILVHVIELMPYPLDFGYGPIAVDLPGKEAIQKFRARLDALGKDYAEANLPVTVYVLTGVAHHEIVNLAKKLESNLIVMATHGYTGINHALIGSTAEKVVRHAPCPVLVVRNRERELV